MNCRFRRKPEVAAIEGQEDFDNYSEMLEISGVFLMAKALRRKSWTDCLPIVNILADADREKFF